MQSELTGDDTSGWRAAATLTKGQVDTFLFLNFAYAEPLNLTACEGLAIDASVPQGQRTGAELLVFLHTADGDRFLAEHGVLSERVRIEPRLRDVQSIQAVRADPR